MNKPNGRTSWLLGGLATAMLVSVCGAFGYALTNNDRVSANTTKHELVQESLKRIESKLDRLIERGS